MKKALLVFAVGSIVAFSASCKKSDNGVDYGIFKVSNDTTVIMNGTINGRTENHFDKMIADHPNINTIILEDCPGSMNDDENLRVSKKIYDNGINTMLRSTSEIASGAVDLFLAGRKRSFESGAKVGVHSWRGLAKTATDFPEDHENHKPYIEYYEYVGMTAEEAKAFYFFTINAAPASDVHWMTEEELMQYNFAR